MNLFSLFISFCYYVIKHAWFLFTIRQLYCKYVVFNILKEFSISKEEFNDQQKTDFINRLTVVTYLLLSLSALVLANNRNKMMIKVIRSRKSYDRQYNDNSRQNTERKAKDLSTQCHLQSEMNSCASEGYTFPAPLMSLVCYGLFIMFKLRF